MEKRIFKNSTSRWREGDCMLYQEQKQSTSVTFKKASIGTYLKCLENLSAYEQKIKRWTEICKTISKCKLCTKKWQVSIMYSTYYKL